MMFARLKGMGALFFSVYGAEREGVNGVIVTPLHAHKVFYQNTSTTSHTYVVFLSK